MGPLRDQNSRRIKLTQDPIQHVLQKLWATAATPANRTASPHSDDIDAIPGHPTTTIGHELLSNSGAPGTFPTRPNTARSDTESYRYVCHC
jgi:hypothetical protein